MSRLVRCDRCDAEVALGNDQYGTAEIPILNADDVSSDHASKDLCRACLVGLWSWLAERRKR